MKQLRSALVLAAAIVGTWTITTATAQSAIPGFVYMRDSQGQIWFTGRDGAARGLIPLYPATDEQIAAIPSTGQYLVPKPDGTGLEVGPRPEWDATFAGAVAPVPAAVAPAPAPTGIRLGADRGQNTAPFNLPAGHYQVSWRSSLNPGQSSCFTSGTLRRVEAQARVESLFSAAFYRSDGKVSDAGETRVYGVQAGQHYVDTGTGSCAWSVEIKPT